MASPSTQSLNASQSARLYRIPKFDIPSQPELHAAINALSDAVARVADGIPTFGDSATIKKNEVARGHIIFDAFIPPSVGPSSAKDPWQPYYVNEGEILKVGFRLGSINNVIPSNWSEKHTVNISEGDNETFVFIVLTVNTDNGKVTSAEISLDSTPPETDTVAKDVPPSLFKIPLGAVGRSKYYMLEKTTLFYKGVVVFLETKAAPAVGAEPFSRWYAWEKTGPPEGI